MPLFRQKRISPLKTVIIESDCDGSPPCLPLRIEHCLFAGLSFSSLIELSQTELNHFWESKRNRRLFWNALERAVWSHAECLTTLGRIIFSARIRPVSLWGYIKCCPLSPTKIEELTAGSDVKTQRSSAGDPTRVFRMLVRHSNHWATKPWQELRANSRLSPRCQVFSSLWSDPDCPSLQARSNQWKLVGFQSVQSKVVPVGIIPNPILFFFFFPEKDSSAFAAEKRMIPTRASFWQFNLFTACGQMSYLYRLATMSSTITRGPLP